MTQATTDVTAGPGPAGPGRTSAPAQPRPPGVGVAAIATVLATVGGWCAYASFVVWQGVTGSPLVWQDSYAYASVARSPVSSRGFWAGPRPPLVPLVMKFVSSAQEFTALQSVIAVASWGALAFAVGSVVPLGWRRVLAAWAVLAFATCTPIILWNRSVLSESLSLSLVALLFATGIRLGSRATALRMGAFVAVAAACAAARDAQIFTVALVGVAAGIMAVVRRKRDRAGARMGAVLGASLLLVAGVAALGVAAGQRSGQNLEDVLFVRIFPFADRVAWFADHGMPQAAAVDRLAARTPATPGTAKVVDPDGPGFESLQRWIADGGGSAYVWWLVTHPWYVLDEPLARPERAYNFAGGTLTFYAAVDRVDSPLSSVAWPAWPWLALVALVSVAGAVATGTIRESAWRLVLVLGVTGLGTMLFAWHGDGQETTRHTIEGFTEVRVGTLVCLILALLRPARRSSGPPGPGSRITTTATGDGGPVRRPDRLPLRRRSSNRRSTTPHQDRPTTTGEGVSSPA